jgi:hypothetical protein
MFGVAQIASNEHGPAAFLLDQRLDLVGVVVLIEIGDQDVGALARVSDRHGPADAAVASDDHRFLARQLARPIVAGLAMIRTRVHGGRARHAKRQSSASASVPPRP